MKRGTLVVISWLDAHADSGWGPVKEQTTKPQAVLSVGWVIKDTKKAIVIAADVDPKGQGRKDDCNRTLLVPKGMVLGIAKAEVAK